MVPRVWDTATLLRSIAWLKHQNLHGRNIYIRPKGEHDLSLVDDLTVIAIAEMKRRGFSPAVVVETSPGNFQAWLKHPDRLTKQLGTAAARALAKEFGGDINAADWRHFGRLAGLVNRKRQHQDATTGLYPFVRLVEANGEVYAEADRFLCGVRAEVDERLRQEMERRSRFSETRLLRHEAGMKSIEAFRSDPRYGGDGTRVDLAYAIYAFSRGATQAQVESAICSRDLSHKGNERRQNDYVARTVQKALAAMEQSRGR